jgi:hypothetical protein
MMFLTFLVKLLGNGFAACACVHTTVWPSGHGRPQAASESVKVAFSAGSRKATGLKATVRLEAVAER